VAFEESSTVVKTKYFLLVFLFSASALATGAKDGGGGGVVVCPISNGAKSARLFDLVERTAVRSVYAGDYRNQLAHIKQKLNDQGYSRLAQTIDKMLGFKLVSELSRQANDLGPHWPIDPNCSLMWVAYYDDLQDELQIDRELFDIMSEEDRAALLLHEAVYYRARRIREFVPNSARVRATVRNLIQSRPLNSNDLFNRILR